MGARAKTLIRRRTELKQILALLDYLSREFQEEQRDWRSAVAALLLPGMVVSEDATYYEEHIAAWLRRQFRDGTADGFLAVEPTRPVPAQTSFWRRTSFLKELDKKLEAEE